MPQLPTPAASGDVWGTALNSFLTTAHDNTTTNGGKVKPEGILAGTTGQVLTTTATGPAWASASSEINLELSSTSFRTWAPGLTLNGNLLTQNFLTNLDVIVPAGLYTLPVPATGILILGSYIGVRSADNTISVTLQDNNSGGGVLLASGFSNGALISERPLNFALPLKIAGNFTINASFTGAAGAFILYYKLL